MWLGHLGNVFNKRMAVVNLEKIENYWKEAFDESANQFEEDHKIARWSQHGLDRRTATLERLVLNYLPESRDAQILDAGCGPGTLALRLAGRGIKVFGVDYSVGMLNRARKKAGGIPTPSELLNLSVAKVQQLPLRDNSVDLVTCVGVFQHIENTQPVLREFWRVMKPSAVCIVNAPSARFALRRPIPFYRWFDGRKLWEEAAGIGFERERVHPFLLLPNPLTIFEGVDRVRWIHPLLWPFAHDLLFVVKKP